MIDHAAKLLEPHVSNTVVVGRARPGWICLPDRPRPDLGPLGGIAAALHHALYGGYHHVLTVACDMPRIPVEVIAALIDAAPAYCREAPILACWPASLSEMLDGHLARDSKRSIRGWAHVASARAVAAPVKLVNVNTPADLAIS